MQHIHRCAAKTDDFKVLRGNDLMISDFFCFLPKAKAEIVPLMHARSTPGGAVSRATYDEFKTEFLAKLEMTIADAPIDGLYLAMHGAVHVDGMEDAEGDWIAAARKLVGPICPISVSFDLHGNLSQQIIDQIDLFTAFRHAPHIDTQETMERALNSLIKVIDTGERPFVGGCLSPFCYRASAPAQWMSQQNRSTRNCLRLIALKASQMPL